MNKGEYDKAIGYYEKAYRVANNKLGENHPRSLMVKDNMDKAKQALTDKGNQ